MSFKLIAIRPIYSEENIFLKNLTSDCFYKLNGKYDFKINGSEVIITENNDDIPDFYNQSIKDEDGETTNLHINISAIVGKNGSGKSSLMELLYVSFYKIARKTKIINIEKETIEKVEASEFLDKRLANKLELIAKIIKKEKSFIHHIDDLDKELDLQYRILSSDLIEKLKKEIEESEYDKNVRNIKIEIYYEIDHKLYMLKLYDDVIELFPIENGLVNILTRTLITTKAEFKNISDKIFYNLVINYSIYGLNSNESGLWIEKLFHKNDSYQTPIVLNPYRDKGNIDINSENHLVRSRLLALILAKDVNNKVIAKGKEIKRIKLVFTGKRLTDQLIYWERFTTIFFPKLYTYFFTDPIDCKLPDLDKIDFDSFELKSGKIYTKSLEYILKKIDSIVERYPTFKKYTAIKDDEFVNSELENSLIISLFQDRSHISLKIKQALNFYKYQNYVTDDILEREEIFPISVLLDEVNSYHKLNDFVDLIEFIPPPFFSLELYFDEDNDINNFSNLSSGEKQKIYSLNSIVYHIRNLLSVNKNPDPNLIIYKNFNIILDEIELYYHPELQRTFISDLIEYIKKIDFKNRYRDCIPNINIIFITHSPFILSDIPKQNILFLSVDQNKKAVVKKEIRQTFASNIHEMFTNGFFMEFTKGEFALGKIKKILKFHEILIKTQKNSSRFEFLKRIYDSNIKYTIKFIDLIGEVYLKNILTNHIDNIQSIFYSSTDSQILELERKIEELRKKNE